MQEVGRQCSPTECLEYYHNLTELLAYRNLCIISNYIRGLQRFSLQKNDIHVFICLLNTLLMDFLIFISTDIRFPLFF